MDLYLRRGNYVCVAGGSRAPPAVIKITIVVTTQVMVAHVTPIIGDPTRQTKVTPQEYHAPTLLPIGEISKFSAATKHCIFYTPNTHHGHKTRARPDRYATCE